jgi:hypothetical protein
VEKHTPTSHAIPLDAHEAAEHKGNFDEFTRKAA